MKKISLFILMLAGCTSKSGKTMHESTSTAIIGGADSMTSIVVADTCSSLNDKVINESGNAEQKKAETSEGVPYVPVYDQSEGMRIIRALSEAYGDNPNVIGDFIWSIRCPYFLEGIILMEICWFFKSVAIRCWHGRYWKRYQRANIFVLK